MSKLEFSQFSLADGSNECVPGPLRNQLVESLPWRWTIFDRGHAANCHNSLGRYDGGGVTRNIARQRTTSGNFSETSLTAMCVFYLVQLSVQISIQTLNRPLSNYASVPANSNLKQRLVLKLCGEKIQQMFCACGHASLDFKLLLAESRNWNFEIVRTLHFLVFAFGPLVPPINHFEIFSQTTMRMHAHCLYIYGHITRSLRLCKISQRRHFFERPATYVTTKLSKRGSGLFFCVFYMQPRQNFTCTAGIWPHHEAFQNYVKIPKTAFLWETIYLRQ